MRIRFNCPECGKKLKADPSLAGRTIACTGCGAQLTVPDAPPSDADEPKKMPRPSAAIVTKSDESLQLVKVSPKMPEDLIDMTAMVDIVFFLLIFFLVTSIQVIEATIEMPSPRPPEGATGKVKTITDYEDDPDFIIVRIEEDDSIWVEDTQTFGDQELRVKLRNAKDASDKPRGVLIVGDADATQDAAVRAFDACADAGIEGISFTVQEETESFSG